MPYDLLTSTDNAIGDAIEREHQLQRRNLMMIASENEASDAVKRAQGTMLTNRNALGYPDSRLYPGSQHIDEIESLAIAYAEELWSAEHVNVQPHSGSLANLAVYLAVLNPGDKILALDPQDGGHITHGSDHHVSGELYDTEFYHLDPESGAIDYRSLEERADRIDPDLIISGYSTYPREIDWQRIQAIANRTNAYHLADIAHLSGLIAAGRFPSPVGIADFCTSSTYKTIRAGRGGMILCDHAYAEAVDNALFPMLQGGATMSNIAGKAIGFAEARTDAFKTYIDQVIANARTLSEALVERGLEIFTGGTDTHIVLIDLRHADEGRSGRDVEHALEKAGIIANRVSLPHTQHATNTDGIRLGTTSITANGLETRHMEHVADFIARAIENVTNDSALETISQEITEFTETAYHPSP
ncbi:serine hydroxymethyltransferase [Halorubrum vacuolatum]|uniref:Serine hydroxymethyltransferase n=1 Tax=Halorubrum vacuolatum TaxID=63740 RepID=A0A238VB51_HALVU|nr:serine hydroxymethyltransferase [Halorubrum vacuolatum]SNR31267.1 glycine hydroxymethyltransferase [Halorubrum vacuolatum]